MTCDYSPFYIMDVALEMRVHEALLLAVEMAKETYPHLYSILLATEEKYRNNLESFIGSQDKPQTHLAYKQSK